MNKRTKRLLAMMSAKPKLRTVSGLPPLIYTAKKADFLTDYRIYGQTVDGESVGDRTANLFDMKTFAETCFQHSATVNYTNNTLTFTATSKDAYVNGALSTGGVIPLHYRSSCVDVMPSTTYTISMSTAPKCFISWIDNSFNVVSGYTTIPTNATSYIFTTPENCTKILIRLGKQVENIGDTFVISNIMLNAGSTPLPYEPYGYKVPVTVEGKNLFDENVEQGNYSNIAADNRAQWQTLLPISVGDKVTISKYSDKDIGIAFIIVNDNGKTQIISKQNMYINNKLYDSGWQSFPYSLTSDYAGWLGLIFKGNNFVVTPSDISNIMLNAGSTALPYEPYHAPVTTNLYLPEPIKMVGDEAEYIDYAEQKFHRISGTDLDVTLPALPTLTGTNVLSVGTVVQPGEVEVTGRIRSVPTGGGE